MSCIATPPALCYNLVLWSNSVLYEAIMKHLNKGPPPHLLDMLMPPNLCHLEIFDNEKSDRPNITAPKEIDAIVASLTCSSFINDLHFDKVAIQGVDLMWILENVPKLMKLALVGCRDYYMSIMEVVDQSTNVHLFPIKCTVVTQ
ncbi:hypothetical protein F5146DRAFT_1130542 [Armillaria mellea]|nr:hypothetical protein F5146DRAFT_1130542 [Armillaria mellea]